jgi:hypothetical protein
VRRAALLLFLVAIAGCETSTAPREDAARPASRDASPASADASASTGSDTDAQLATFWEAHGGRSTFPPSYVDAVEALLRTEDDVVAGDWEAADARLDAVFAAHPLHDPVWWSGVEQAGTNVGTPVAYYGLRMLREVVNHGLTEGTGASRPLLMAVVMPACATGRRPTNAAMTDSEAVALTLDPRIAEDDFRVVRQSLRLFQHYVRAIAGGAVHLELRFIEVERCAEVTFRTDPPYAGLVDANAVVSEVPDQSAREVDMWWVLYPSNRPRAPIFEETEFITGGMGGRGRAPLFIIDDTWLLEIPPHLGRGTYTDVERRVYLPQWLQHELFHHLFRTWPEFGLEDVAHQWFDRSTWPEDFVGAWEPDYYAEAVARRLATASPSIAEALDVTIDVSALSLADFVGRYERRPVQNDWHRVEVLREGDALLWSNAAGVRWGLTFEEGVLRSVADSPYGQQELGVEPTIDAEGVAGPPVRSLFFNGEAYVRP